MRLGGIWDHVGFGFHRYSTDQEWLLPHFEKMLYDQALLMIAYTEGWQVTKNELFKQTVYEIAEYVATSLTHEKGAFYSAQDADSEGEEGKFYVWNEEKISNLSELISDDELTFFTQTFNFEQEGNFEDEATKQLTGNNIPFLKNPLTQSNQDLFNQLRPTIFDCREKEIHPITDDKILTDWNALMITALAKAGSIFDDSNLIDVAVKAYSFISENLFENNHLKHSYKDGDASIDAFADDYAFFIQASLELYEATFDNSYLEKAIELSDTFISLFEDDTTGGYFLTSSTSEELLGRQKQIYDGAIPSSNSVALINFIKLSRLTGITSYEEKAQKIGKTFSTDLIRSGSSITSGLQGIQFIHHRPKEVVIVSNKENSLSLLSEMKELFAPFKVMLLKSAQKSDIERLVPYLKDMQAIDGKTTFYVCSNQSCDKPTTSLSEVIKVLKPY